jgi:hypothetical protein
MIELIIFILVCASMTNIIIYESIFRGFQNYLHKKHNNKWYQKLLSCDACLGFWVGVSMFWLFPMEFDCVLELMIVSGLVSSLVCKMFGIWRLK